MINQDQRESTKVQTLIFDKKKFSKEQVKAWIGSHEQYHMLKAIDETEGTFRVRQEEPSKFKKGSFRTITLKSGIQAVIGRPQ